MQLYNNQELFIRLPYHIEFREILKAPVNAGGFWIDKESLTMKEAYERMYFYANFSYN